MTKVAVSLPEDIYEALERLREQRGQSRSAAVADALRGWIESQEPRDDDRAYSEAYLRTPERVAELASIAAEAAAGWEPWE